VQAFEQVGHVAGLARQLGDLEQRTLQVLGAFTIGHFIAQGVIEARQLKGPAGDGFFQLRAVQNTVQSHGHVTGHHQKQLLILDAVDPLDVIDLHRQHAEHVVGSVFQRRPHPEFRAMAHTVKAVQRPRPLDPGGIDEQRLLGGQHITGHGQPLRIEKLVGFRFKGVEVGDVDVIRVSDFAAVAFVQRQVEVFRVDQGRELFVHALQKCSAVTGRAGQVGDFIKHPLGRLGPRQRVGLQAQAKTSCQLGEKWIV
jgi:hypothetical protein